MRKRSWTLVAVLAVFALAMTACSDVDEDPPAGDTGGETGATGGGEATVAQCGSETIVLAVNPWVGAAANANVAKNIMESEMGCTVELQEVNESAQFPAMADGDVDATLEVWPSGHAKDRKDYIDKAGTVVDAGELGIIGNIGWFTPSYVVEQNPDYATWEGFKDNADEFATAETGDKGRFLGADTTYSIFDEAIIASLGLDLEVVYSGSEAASLAALDKAYENQDPILMYWWTPQWANAKYDLVEVELPAYTEECGQIAAEDPDVAVGYDCDYAEDVLYKAFSAELETKDPAAFAFLSSFNWTDDDQNGVALRDPGRDRPERGGTDLDRREPGHVGSVVADQLRQRRVSGAWGGLRVAPRSCERGAMAESVQLFIDGDWVDAEGGAMFDAIGPSTGAVVGTVAEGTRGDAQRAIDAANRAWPAWAALSVFDRAAAMERVAEVIDERRDDLARTLTLDQGKPLRAEAYDEVAELITYFEMAAADARRMEGLMPPSVDANKRVLLYRVPRGVVSIISPWNWPYTMPAEILAPAIAYGNTVVWAPGADHVDLRGEAGGVHRGGRDPAGRREHGDRPRSGGRRRDRRQPGHPGRRVHRVDRDGADRGRPRRGQGAAAGDGRERTAGGHGRRRPGRGRRGDAHRLFPERRAELHRRRADPGPRGRARGVPRPADGRDRQADPHRRSVRRRHDARSGEQRADRRQDRAARARRGRSTAPWCWPAGAARRATAASCSSRRRSWTASRPTWRSRARRRSVRWRRSRRSDRSTRRSAR